MRHTLAKLCYVLNVNIHTTIYGVHVFSSMAGHILVKH